ITDSLLGSLPGADSVKSATNFFLNISLGYIDEFCLSYTFYNRDQNAYKSACDGVVIYAQNWKHLLKNAAMTALTVVVSILVVTLLAFVLFGGAFRLLGWSGFVAFVLAVMLTWTIKFAFIDSWMMVKMMHGYMQVAPTTTITFDLYTQLSGLSSSFKKLFNESRVTPETTTAVSHSYVPAQPKVEAPVTERIVAQVVEPVAKTEVTSVPTPTGEVKPRFCSECGTPLKVGMAFCGNCGTNIG
ncbi:MAG: zinc ribbon domain-containing protein, partial [Bacteroidaceae bacterium]|nr:zinc ribbon domain-containing protein [Bacteroidaceae bacterium]